MARTSIRLAAAAVVVTFWSLIGLVAAQGGTVDTNNRFIYPPPGGQGINENATVYSANINITYGVEQRQSFEWTTTWNLGVTIYLWQEGPPNSVQSVRLVACDSDASFYGSFYWDGDIGAIDLKNGTIAFLIAYQCNGTVSAGSPFFFSHYFNLTAAATTTTTTTLTTTTTRATSTTATTTPTSTTTRPTDASGTAVANMGSSSNGAALGGGIGGGIGGALLLIAAGLFFFYWRRKQRGKTAQATTAFTPVSQYPNSGSSPSGYFPASSNGGTPGVGVGAGAAYGQQAYKYGSPQNDNPPRSELGGESSEVGSGGGGGAYGYYDGREYKPVGQHQSPSGRLPELGS